MLLCPVQLLCKHMEFFSAFNTQSGTTVVSFPTEQTVSLPTEQCLSSGLPGLLLLLQLLHQSVFRWEIIFHPLATVRYSHSLLILHWVHWRSHRAWLIWLVTVLLLHHHQYLLIPILFMCDLLKEISVCVRAVRVLSSVQMDHCLHLHLTCVVPVQKSAVSETAMEFWEL